jgi:hypothetical protein
MSYQATVGAGCDRAGADAECDTAGLRGRFVAICDDGYRCRVCAEPAIPHIVFSPCGHAACGACSGRVETCPVCHGGISNQVHYHALTERIRASIRYKCTDANHRKAGCDFTGNLAEAARHEDAYRPVAISDDPSPNAVLFWHLDSLELETVRTAVAPFFKTLLQHLLSVYGIKIQSSVAYMTAWKGYSVTPEKLSNLQIRMCLSSGKREDTERDLWADARQYAVQTGQRACIVLLASDGVFIRLIKELVDAGNRVIVVHDSPNPEYRELLDSYASGAVPVTDFMITTNGGRGPAALWLRRV